RHRDAARHRQAVGAEPFRRNRNLAEEELLGFVPFVSGRLAAVGRSGTRGKQQAGDGGEGRKRATTTERAHRDLSLVAAGRTTCGKSAPVARTGDSLLPRQIESPTPRGRFWPWRRHFGKRARRLAPLSEALPQHRRRGSVALAPALHREPQ